MKIFVAASYSSQVNYEAGEVNHEYRDWLETELSALESAGHSVFCALREDDYKINNADPAQAFRLDEREIKESDALLAFVNENPSVGVQTEIGYALALGKKVYLARDKKLKLAYFNNAIILAGQATEITFPVSENLSIFD